MTRLARLAWLLPLLALLVLGGGAAVGLLAEGVASLPRRAVVVLFLGAMLAGAILITGRAKSILLFAWVVSLTYNRQYFSFDAVTGDNGPAGLYWIVSDLFLLCLVGSWLQDKLRRNGTTAARAFSLWPWYLGYAAACCISVLLAERVDWGLFELVRTAKFALVLLLVAHHFTKEDWWTALAALGAAALLQSGLGIMEVVSRRTGVLWIFGLQDDMASVPQMFKDESFYGFVRATATMAHPPNLACYLLLCLPPLLALALALRSRWLRLAVLGASAVGLAGLACTLSRWPAVVMAIQFTVLALSLAGLNEISIKRVLGVGFVGGLCLVVVALGFSDLVVDRASRDFARSVDLRAKEYGIALAMLRDNPLFGVGLNNYTAHLVAYGSELRWGLDPRIANLATQVLHVRYISGPLNAFLLVAAETGILGLIGFVTWCLGTIVAGVHAVRRTRGAVRVVCVGLTVGMAGVYLQQAVDYSYWVDPVLYTMALAAAMLAKAPALFPAVVAPTRPA
jgi:hypothetical protein